MWDLLTDIALIQFFVGVVIATYYVMDSKNHRVR